MESMHKHVIASAVRECVDLAFSRGGTDAALAASRFADDLESKLSAYGEAAEFERLKAAAADRLYRSLLAVQPLPDEFKHGGSAVREMCGRLEKVAVDTFALDMKTAYVAVYPSTREATP